MKRTNIFWLILLLASCNKYDELSNVRVNVNTTKQSIINVNKEVSSRTSIVGTKAKWSMNDAISVFDDLGTYNSKFDIIRGNVDVSSAFNGIFSNITPAQRNIYAVYPFTAGAMTSDNKTYTFLLPSTQVQNGAVDSLGIGRYCYMVATPNYASPESTILNMNQITTIVDFDLINIPTGLTVTKVMMRAKNIEEDPFISEGKIDITKMSNDADFLKIAKANSVNGFSVIINKAPISNFSASMVVFPFAITTTDMEIIVTARNNNGTIKTYLFERDNIDLSLFKRRTRIATKLDFNGKIAELANSENYSIWDGITQTQPSDFNQSTKTMTIMHASDLAWVAAQTENYSLYDGFNGYKITLGVNIDLGGVFDGTTWSGVQWIPIGNKTRPFLGEFDGNGYKIRNIFISNTSIEYIGLFGYCSDGSLKNIIIENGSVSSSSYSSYGGGICGSSSSTLYQISNCINNSNVSSGSYSGGICGRFSTMTNCINNGIISSKETVGGIGGGYATIIDCMNNGKVLSSSGSSVLVGTGGIGGVNCNISNCINYGDVDIITPSSSSSTPNVGGICGRNSWIKNCINNGNITSHSNAIAFSYAGGISGAQGHETLDYCVNNGNIYSYHKSFTTYSGGICGQSGRGTRNCINYGNVVSTSENYSSIAGGISGESSLSYYCINYGDVSSTSPNKVISYSGGIVGSFHSSADIYYCVNYGKISSTSNLASYSGGIATSGSCYIYGCVNNGDILSSAGVESYSGGITCIDAPKIYNCINNGKILGNSTYTGGILANGRGIISGCYSVGNNSYPGIVGTVKGTTTIQNCFHTAIAMLGSGTATIIGGGQLSATTWPNSTMTGWGDTVPADWDNSKYGSWNSPWASLGSWNGGNPIYPQLYTENY